MMKFVWTTSSLLLLLATTCLEVVASSSSNSSVSSSKSSVSFVKKDAKGFPVNPKDTGGESVRDAIERLPHKLSSFAKALNATSDPNYLELLGKHHKNREWTIFVPTNEAFDELSNKEKIMLTSSQWTGHRDRLLGYHIVSGEVTDDDFDNEETISSLFGFELKLSTNSDGGKVFNTEEYTSAEEPTKKEHYDILEEIETSNGKIYIINKIIRFHMTRETIHSLGSSSAQFSDLMAMTELAGVTKYSKEDGPKTIIAPTNEALEGVGLTGKGSKFDPDLFRKIFEYHIIPNRNLYAGNSLTPNSTIPTALAGESITITETGIDSARVLAKGILLSNGVVIIVDSLLLPQSMLTVSGDEENWKDSNPPENGMKWRLVKNHFYYWCSVEGNSKWVPLENKNKKCDETDESK